MAYSPPIISKKEYPDKIREIHKVFGGSSWVYQDLIDRGIVMFPGTLASMRGDGLIECVSPEGERLKRQNRRGPRLWRVAPSGLRIVERSGVRA